MTPRLSTPAGRRAKALAGAQESNLRRALLELLAAEEQTLLNSYWPCAELPLPDSRRRLCSALADQVSRDELGRIERARRALGFSLWKDLPLRHGLRPGRTR